MNRFLEKLKDELEYQGITQKELAAKTGLSVNTIHSWFSKDIIPPLDSAYKVAQTIKQPLEYLINGDIFPPDNYVLSTREKNLLTNYNKLDDEAKKIVDNLINSFSDYVQKNNQSDSDNSIF